MTSYPVHRTPKMLIGGAFVRSEAQHVLSVTSAEGEFLANVPRGTRKDARDAVSAARKGFTAWTSMTAYNRGQVILRIAEMLQGRSEQLIAEIMASEGSGPDQARAQLNASIDTIVWHAGWPDKLPAVLGSVNPVSGTAGSTSAPVPSGIVSTVAAADAALLGIVRATCGPLAAGCSVIAIADSRTPLPAVTFAEIIATSDVPAGAANILTGLAHEMLPTLAAHQDVNVLDLSAVRDPELATACERTAADSLKRVRRPDPDTAPSLDRLRSYLETRTTWGTIGR